MVARISLMKGHEIFLRAASQVIPSVPESTFFLVGGRIPAYDGLYRHLITLRSELGLDDKVHFVEHLDRCALRAFMGSLALLAVPSIWPEGGGLVALEAMSLGLPVVAARHGGPAEIISDGEDGRLVTPRDPTALADAITELLGDSALRETLGTRARKKIELQYALPLQVSRLANVYGEIVSPRGI
jgi:glycosyltransferase involved in cell wall biosynthesis